MSAILIWLVTNIGGRVLISLGMGFISYASVTIAFELVVSNFSTIWSGVPSAILAILSIAGFPTAMGWVIGALLARLSITTLSKIGRIPD